MKFEFYGYAENLMPGEAWWHFWWQFSKIWPLGNIDLIKNDLANTDLAKNECSGNFNSRACTINRKRDLSECSRSTGEIVNFAHQASL